MRASEFILPSKVLYMCGHSLGPMTKSSKNNIQSTMTDWGNKGVLSWNQSDWMNLPYVVSEKIAVMIGASALEVMVSDSTSVNLFKVLLSALRIGSKKRTILTTDDNFSADLYIAQGILAFDQSVTLKTVKKEDLISQLDDNISVLMLTQVNYRDSSVYDMKEITKRAHDLGIIVVWDLSHSVGIVPLNLKECDIDFAVGCTYKYLNGGPGAPSFVYVNERHHSVVKSPIYGWMGHHEPFLFSGEYQSSGTIFISLLKNTPCF